MPEPAGRLREVAALFLRLGLTAFGGPAAHVAMMQREVVERRGWLKNEEFLDLLAATNFIPGPNSTELAIHLGYRRAGLRGLAVAGACFILPAVLLTLGFAWLYVRYGKLPEASATLYGIKPVIVAVVVQALVQLGRTAIKSARLAGLAVAAVVANALGADELGVLAVAGAVAALLFGPRRAEPGRAPCLVLLGTAPVAAAAASQAVSATGILLVFLKIGSVLFGSGYVLLAFLRAELVDARRWLDEGQLLDAVAVGQVTPGPVFSTATFVGYLLDGHAGALAATVGIFAPAFFFVAVTAPLVARLRRSSVAARALDGLNVASLALMAVATFGFGKAALVDVWSVALAVASAGLLLRSKLNSAWLVLAGGLIGNAVHYLG